MRQNQSNEQREIRKSVIWTVAYFIVQFLSQYVLFALLGIPGSGVCTLFMALTHIVAHIAGLYACVGYSMSKSGRDINPVPVWTVPMATVETLGAAIFVYWLGVGIPMLSVVTKLSVMIGLIINFFSFLIIINRQQSIKH